VPEEIFFRTFVVQGRIINAHTLTIRLGATPSRVISDPRPSSPIFMPDAIPAATLPLCHGLGQAPNMLDCIPSGMVAEILMNQKQSEYCLGCLMMLLMHFVT